MDEECKHGFDPAWCSSCKDPIHAKPRVLRPVDEREDWEKPQARAQQAPRFSFVARYNTVCDGCRMMVRPGQDAVKMNDGTTRHNLPGCILATAGQA